MSKQPKYDLPPQSGNGTVPLLLDGNFRNYSTLENGGGVVFVERYAVRKQFVNRQAIGTPSAIRPETYLTQETNFTDVGGGWLEFERHYSELPASWFEFELVGVQCSVTRRARLVQEGAELVRQQRIARLSIFLPGFGTSSGESYPTLAKATYRYVLEGGVEEASELSLSGGIIRSPFLNVGDSWKSPQFIPKIPEVTLFSGTIYQIKSYTATITVESEWTP